MNNEKLARLIRTQTDDDLLDGIDKVQLAYFIRGLDDDALVILFSDELEPAKPEPKRAAKPKAGAVAPQTLDAVFDSVTKGFDTRGAIRGNTGLGTATISRALDELIKRGAVTQTGVRNAVFSPAPASNGAAEATAL